MPPSQTVRRLLRPFSSLSQCSRRSFTTTPRISSSSLNDIESRLPRVANPSLWSSLVPKPLRRTTTAPKPTKRKDRNPYTIFIVLGVVIGSNAINIIALRNDVLNFTRKTDAWLERLREAVQQVKRGEDVDVKKLLGTRNAGAEKEWDQVMDELEQSDALWEGKLKKEEKVRQQKVEEERRSTERDEWRRRQDEERESGKGNGASRPKFMM